MNTIVVGLTWKPVNAIAVKVDWQFADPDGSTDATQTWNGGIGFMF